MSALSLIDAGDNESVKISMDEQGRSPLHYCSENTSVDRASALLQDESVKRRILNLRDNEGYTALHLGMASRDWLYLLGFYFRLACIHGSETMVEFLCQQGADVKLSDNESHSLVHWITGRSRVARIAESGTSTLCSLRASSSVRYSPSIQRANAHGGCSWSISDSLCVTIIRSLAR